MKYALTCFGTLMIFLLHAQTEPPVTTFWHYGIKGDLNFSNVQGNGMASSYTAGFQAGVYAERVLNNKWSVQPELLLTQNYSKKGADFLNYYITNGGNANAADDIKLAYISVPVLLKYTFNKYFQAMAGPQYGLLVVDAESLEQSGDGKAFKRSEFSANAGAQFTTGSVSIYGRYNQGLSNINNIDNRYNWHSRHIQLGIAIKIK